MSTIKRTGSDSTPGRAEVQVGGSGVDVHVVQQDAASTGSGQTSKSPDSFYLLPQILFVHGVLLGLIALIFSLILDTSLPDSPEPYSAWAAVSFGLTACTGILVLMLSRLRAAYQRSVQTNQTLPPNAPEDLHRKAPVNRYISSPYPVLFQTHIIVATVFLSAFWFLNGQALTGYHESPPYYRGKLPPSRWCTNGHIRDYRHALYITFAFLASCAFGGVGFAAVKLRFELAWRMKRLERTGQVGAEQATEREKEFLQEALDRQKEILLPILFVHGLSFGLVAVVFGTAAHTQESYLLDWIKVSFGLSSLVGLCVFVAYRARRRVQTKTVHQSQGENSDVGSTDSVSFFHPITSSPYPILLQKYSIGAIAVVAFYWFLAGHQSSYLHNPPIPLPMWCDGRMRDFQQVEFKTFAWLTSYMFSLVVFLSIRMRLKIARQTQTISSSLPH